MGLECQRRKKIIERKVMCTGPIIQRVNGNECVTISPQSEIIVEMRCTFGIIASGVMQESNNVVMPWIMCSIVSEEKQR